MRAVGDNSRCTVFFECISGFTESARNSMAPPGMPNRRPAPVKADLS